MSIKMLKIVPQIDEFKDFKTFNETYNLKKDDLIFTNEYIYNPIIKPLGLKTLVLFQEDYGTGEPTDSMVDEILRDIASINYDRLIAIGGGTVIDIAKVLVVADGVLDSNLLYDDMTNLKAYHDLIAIPTTCGTGSEVTNISILNRTGLGTKQGLVSDSMYPKYACLIPEFMKTLPYAVFATSSIDALIHAIESMLSPLSTNESTEYSKKAIESILKGYIFVAKDRNLYKELGNVFLKASNDAGIAFSNAGCGTIHAMSYAFGGKYHVAHGESNYQFLMPVLEFYKEKNPNGKISDLEALIALTLSVSKEDALNSLKDLLEEIIHLKPMNEYGAIEEDLMEFSISTMNNQKRLLSRSNVELKLEDIYGIYSKCMN